MSRGVAAGIARSWLLVSAELISSVASAEHACADQLIIDLEDGVDPSRKREAREQVAAWLAEGNQGWVRINPRSSESWGADIKTLRDLQGLSGIMLAKTETADDVRDTWDAVGGRVPILPLIESALGIEDATAIAKAPGAFRLAFGSGDYRRDTGASAHELAMAYPRSRLVVASRIGGLPGPIDGPTVSTGHAVLRDQASLAVALGMTGKLCLNADQIPVINEVIGPTSSDLAWAVEFLSAFDAEGGRVRDGSDPPRLARARKIQHLAGAFGVEGD